MDARRQTGTGTRTGKFSSFLVLQYRALICRHAGYDPSATAYSTISASSVSVHRDWTQNVPSGESNNKRRAIINISNSEFGEPERRPLTTAPVGKLTQERVLG